MRTAKVFFQNPALLFQLSLRTAGIVLFSLFGAAVLSSCASTQQLSQAVKEGNAERVRHYLNWTVVYKNLNGWGESALHLAVSRPWPEITEAVLADGADINKKDIDGNTPLAKAAFWGNADAVDRLLRLGADPDEANQDGQTPLWIAAARGQREALCRLLEAGADPETEGLLAPYGGTTPLTAALTGGYTAAASILLQFGADPELRTGGSEELPEPLTALQAAIHAGRAESVALLLQSPAYSDVRFTKNDPELFIAREGHKSLIESLLLRQEARYSPGAAEKLRIRLEGNRAVALAALPFRGSLEPALLISLEDALIQDVQQNPKLTLVSRGGLEALFEEINFQLSGLTSDDGPAAAELGRLTRAEYILLPSYTAEESGEGYLRLSLISVAEGALAGRQFVRVSDPSGLEAALHRALGEIGLSAD
ncbi:MAG: ankyrin repeat domain-containing protein [Spirochaetota bacterium]|nr:ankyrin repeat domain-containing protein [Spirochaetota bacterium]